MLTKNALYDNKVFTKNKNHVNFSVSFWKVLHSENIKFWNLRSNYYFLAIIFVFMTSVAASSAKELVNSHKLYGTAINPSQGDTIGFEFVAGLILVVLLFAYLSATSITNEYSSKTIIATFAIYPKKNYALLAKLLHNILITLSLGIASISISYIIVQQIRSEQNLGYGLFDFAVLPTIFSTLFYLTCVTIISFSIGILLRKTCATIIAISVLFFVAPISLNILANSLKFKDFLPTELGARLISMQRDSVTGFSIYSTQPLQNIYLIISVLLIWSLATLAIALFVVTKREL